MISDRRDSELISIYLHVMCVLQIMKMPSAKVYKACLIGVIVGGSPPQYDENMCLEAPNTSHPVLLPHILSVDVEHG
jgi:hypothetical protein